MAGQARANVGGVFRRGVVEVTHEQARSFAALAEWGAGGLAPAEAEGLRDLAAAALRTHRLRLSRGEWAALAAIAATAPPEIAARLDWLPQ